MRRPVEVPRDLVRYLEEVRPGETESLRRRGIVTIDDKEPKARA